MLNNGLFGNAKSAVNCYRISSSTVDSHETSDQRIIWAESDGGDIHDDDDDDQGGLLKKNILHVRQ